MSTNMTLITSVTVGSGGAASVTLPATGTIPATYTDLKVVFSVRCDQAVVANSLGINFNSSSTGYYYKSVYGNGASVVNDQASNYSKAYCGDYTGTSATSNTFSNIEIYIPNYAGSNAKSFSCDSVSENNGTTARANIIAGLWDNSAAITSLVIAPFSGTGNFVEGSTFYLYGISNVTSTTKATGGIVSSDGTYNYHMFPYSGTFTPTQNITADYLVIAGGGGGGRSGGGGGAGGLRSTVTATGGGGSLESALSLTANTGYTVTIGAGGTGSNTDGVAGTTGGNSVFSTITSTGGGGGGSYQSDGTAGGSGGGGGVNDGAAQRTYGAGTANQGYRGGTPFNNNLSTNRGPGGGGGAGAVGANGASAVAGAGGAGVQIATIANATQTGVDNGYYAGGGGGAAYSPGGALGGLGGGGAGRNGTGAGTAGTVNTGGGGGGGSDNTGAAGGSGLVIIRYAI